MTILGAQLSLSSDLEVFEQVYKPAEWEHMSPWDSHMFLGIVPKKITRVVREKSTYALNQLKFLQ